MREKCIICGSTDLLLKKYNQHIKVNHTLKQKVKKFIKKIIKRNSTMFNGYVDICNSCGYGAMENIPNVNELQKYYNTQYWDWRATNVTEIPIDGYKNDDRANTQIQLVLEYLPDINNVLEVGAGGAFASLKLRDFFKEKNKKVDLYVCEPGKQWVEYYKTQEIIRIAEFFPFFSDIKFDYIHTSHWLEHITDVRQTVKELSGLLNENGYLFIEVPNTGKNYWDLDFEDIPHIHFFTKFSLQKLMENNGFDCLYIEEYGVTHQEYYLMHHLNNYNKQENGIWIRAIFRK